MPILQTGTGLAGGSYVKPGPHRLQNPALPFDTPRSDAAPLSLPDVAPEFAATIPAHIRKKAFSVQK
ncbi:hypothetical protein D3C71_948080 [compost metagenome]|jgi:hypothetical protein